MWRFFGKKYYFSTEKVTGGFKITFTSDDAVYEMFDYISTMAPSNKTPVILIINNNDNYLFLPEEFIPFWKDKISKYIFIDEQSANHASYFMTSKDLKLLVSTNNP